MRGIDQCSLKSDLDYGNLPKESCVMKTKPFWKDSKNKNLSSMSKSGITSGKVSWNKWKWFVGGSHPSHQEVRKDLAPKIADELFKLHQFNKNLIMTQIGNFSIYTNSQFESKVKWIPFRASRLRRKDKPTVTRSMAMKRNVEWHTPSSWMWGIATPPKKWRDLALLSNKRREQPEILKKNLLIK